jgi:hypothetical protein
VEFSFVRGLVKVQISTPCLVFADFFQCNVETFGDKEEWARMKMYLIGTFSRKDHFYPEGLDFSRHEKHRRGRANTGYIVRLKVINNVLNGIKPLLNGVFKSVVNRAEGICHLLGSLRAAVVL